MSIHELKEPRLENISDEKLRELAWKVYQSDQKSEAFQPSEEQKKEVIQLINGLDKPRKFILQLWLEEGASFKAVGQNNCIKKVSRQRVEQVVKEAIVIMTAIAKWEKLQKDIRAGLTQWEEAPIIDPVVLSPRTLNALEKAGIRIGQDIVTKTEREIAEIQGIGKKSLREIRVFLMRNKKAFKK